MRAELSRQESLAEVLADPSCRKCEQRLGSGDSLNWRFVPIGERQLCFVTNWLGVSSFALLGLNGILHYWWHNERAMDRLFLKSDDCRIADSTQYLYVEDFLDTSFELQERH